MANSLLVHLTFVAFYRERSLLRQMALGPMTAVLVVTKSGNVWNSMFVGVRPVVIRVLATNTGRSRRRRRGPGRLHGLAWASSRWPLLRSCFCYC